MCLIFFALQQHEKYPLIIAANRDEFYARQTAAAGFWPEDERILAGRDLEACEPQRGCGTWLGVNRNGRLALVTNYRDPKNINPKAPSRGHLVSAYLRGADEPEHYLHKLLPEAPRYNGFNLVVGDAHQLWYCSNYREGITKLEPGIHGLSNHLMDTPWPKVQKGKAEFEEMLTTPFSEDDVFDFLANEEIAEDDQLPDTGIGLERERALSAMFIKTPNYGSRCSTLITVDHQQRVRFTERVYDTRTFDYTQQTFAFEITA